MMDFGVPSICKRCATQQVAVGNGTALIRVHVHDEGHITKLRPACCAESREGCTVVSQAAVTCLSITQLPLQAPQLRCIPVVLGLQLLVLRSKRVLGSYNVHHFTHRDLLLQGSVTRRSAFEPAAGLMADQRCKGTKFKAIVMSSVAWKVAVQMQLQCATHSANWYGRAMSA